MVLFTREFKNFLRLKMHTSLVHRHHVKYSFAIIFLFKIKRFSDNYFSEGGAQLICVTIRHERVTFFYKFINAKIIFFFRNLEVFDWNFTKTKRKEYFLSKST